MCYALNHMFTCQGKQTGTAFANLGPATSLATPRATTLFWAREDFGSLEAVHEM